MSFNTPILTVLSWAKAGAAKLAQASAMNAAECRASIVLIELPPELIFPIGTLFGAFTGGCDRVNDRGFR
jgi:hypothetical protein